MRTLFLWFLLLTAWLCASLPVFSQEAYYWTYAQHPDLAYFDHPPMVAWLIWLGTQLCGDGAVGIRAATWSCGVITTLAGLRLLQRFGVDEPGQRTWIALSIASPVLTMTHFLATPDPPLVCGWTVCIYALWRARDGALGWWTLAGATAGAALLSKYTAGFLAVGGVALLLLDERMRRQLRRPGPWLGVLVAVLVFSPVVIWNAQHDFESFRFQTEGRFRKGHFAVQGLFDMVGQQLGMLHPAIALALPFAVWALWPRARGDARILWLLAFGLPMPAFWLFQSLWIQIKVNWLAPPAVPLMLALIVWLREHAVGARWPRLVRIARATLWVVPLCMPLAPALRLLPQSAGSSWTGWAEIAAHADALADRIAARDGRGPFFFAADYRDAAQLGRNLQLGWHERDAAAAPAAAGYRAPVLAQNTVSIPALQFDHWTDPTALVGQTAIFVLPRFERRPGMLDDVRRHFVDVEFAERVEIRPLGIPVLDVGLFVCRGYRGPYERSLWVDREPR